MDKLSPLAKYGIASIVGFIVLLVLLNMRAGIVGPAEETERRTDAIERALEKVEEAKEKAN